MEQVKGQTVVKVDGVGLVPHGRGMDLVPAG